MEKKPAYLWTTDDRLKLKRVAFYTSSDRQELDRETEKILEEEADER